MGCLLGKGPPFFDRFEVLVNAAGFGFDISDEGDGACAYTLETEEYESDDQDEENIHDGSGNPEMEIEAMFAAWQFIETHPMADLNNFWKYV